MKSSLLFDELENSVEGGNARVSITTELIRIREGAGEVVGNGSPEAHFDSDDGTLLIGNAYFLLSGFLDEKSCPQGSVLCYGTITYVLQ